MLREGAKTAQLPLDFRTYMCGAADLVRPYDICRDNEFVSGFVYPPPSILYFHLLSRLPIDAAFLIHSAITATCLAAAAWTIVKMTPVSRRSATCALLGALAIAPIGTSFAAGQVNVMVMTFSVAAVYFAAHSRPASAGIAVALGFWLKLYPGVVPVLFLNRRKFPAVIATCLATALLAVVALLWSSLDLYLQYFLELLPHAQRYTMPGVASSIAGIAAHAAAGGLQPIYHFVPIPMAIQLLSKAALVGGILLALAHQRLTRDEQPLDSLNILLATALVTAPNSWGYHYALLFPMVLAQLAQAIERPSPMLAVVVPCWLALLLPSWTQPPGFMAEVPLLNVLVQGRYAFVAAILIGVTLFRALPGSANRAGTSTRSDGELSPIPGS
ncbi:glycosyltransferase family 87 protein [Novosphingobium sp. JCM 18896]|uniref:glycosyltransferase family 87 protein n=1 Tax=Novosphingobium sp. JCM 18896 TaxID=2989731 RepID=UPI002222A18D|nr:glycosyltransferase family 87 protein [Novosphingobium sp. JCM 18896]MCW1427936.1 DUF2029 domain-containing protein [Novosphingobium sp. JCM 18896]